MGLVTIDRLSKEIEICIPPGNLKMVVQCTRYTVAATAWRYLGKERKGGREVAKRTKRTISFRKSVQSPSVGQKNVSSTFLDTGLSFLAFENSPLMYAMRAREAGQSNYSASIREPRGPQSTRRRFALTAGVRIYT